MIVNNPFEQSAKQYKKHTNNNYDIPRSDDDFGPLVIEMGIDSLKYILG